MSSLSIKVPAGTTEPDPKKVFVVHGRNERLRKDFFSFLRAIGLEPIEWTEAIKLSGKSAPYIGEILDSAFHNAQAVIVLFSPDDEARLHESFLTPNDPPYERQLTLQARQNVLFEAGMAIAYKPERTVFVEVGQLRPFSDIYGRHTVKLTNDAQRRQDLANRLRNAGCDTDSSGTDWLTCRRLRCRGVSELSRGNRRFQDFVPACEDDRYYESKRNCLEPR